MTAPSESNSNPFALDDSVGFLDPTEKLPPQASTSQAQTRLAADATSPVVEESDAKVAVAVAEPPAIEKPLSKKEKKAKAKADKLRAKEQAKADKLRAKEQAKADKLQAKNDAIAQQEAEKAERLAEKAAAKQAKKEQRQQSFWYRSSGLALRLLGLGIAGSLAAIGGITVASFIAAPPSEDAPLLERGIEGTSEGLSATQRLPKKVLQGIAERINPAPKPVVQAAAPILTEPQQQQLIAESNALRQEIAQITQRTSLVEQQLGYDYSDGDLEQRLAAIAQTLTDPSAGPQVATPKASQPEPLVMTLPTDPMFDDEQSALKPGANALLVTLLGEMRAYDKAIVTVTVHSDGVGSTKTQRDLSLRRAQVVSNYLRAQVGDNSPGNSPGDSFIWNPIGAGNTQPLVANDSNENRQRNRRIEISVTPK